MRYGWDMGKLRFGAKCKPFVVFMLVVYVLLALWWERGLWLQEHSNQPQEGTWPCGVSAWSNQVRRQPLNFDMIIHKHLGILVPQGAGSCVLWSSPTQAPETYRGSVVLQCRALSNGITCLWDWKVSIAFQDTYLNQLCEFNSMHILYNLDRPISQITKKLFLCFLEVCTTLASSPKGAKQHCLFVTVLNSCNHVPIGTEEEPARMAKRTH